MQDKISEFWEISKQEINDNKIKAKYRDQEIEELKERHKVEKNVFRQKVKHLLYEHRVNVTSFTTDAEHALSLLQEEYRKLSLESSKSRHSLKLQLKEAGLAHEDAVRKLKLENAKEITKVRQEYELNAKGMDQMYENKLGILRESYSQKHAHEVHEIEERKNAHIANLMRNHDAAFSEIKNYYNDITHNNLDVIKTLKDDIAQMKQKEAVNDQLMHEISQENKRLTQPLTKALHEVDELRKSTTTQLKDAQSLAYTRSRLLDSEKALMNMKWEHEVQLQRFIMVEKERDELRCKFESAIQQVQQKSGLQSVVLERKLEALDYQLEKHEAQFGEVLAATNLEPSVLLHVTRKLDEVLDSKNQLIMALQLDLSRISRAHNDLIRVYEAKLAEYGLPLAEIGFSPLMANIESTPAGLVAGSG